MNDTVEFRDVAVLLPLAASATALSFDVGTFYGIGRQYFTLFSLSEHIMFALPAVPFAVMSIVGCHMVMQWRIGLDTYWRKLGFWGWNSFSLLSILSLVVGGVALFIYGNLSLLLIALAASLGFLTIGILLAAYGLRESLLNLMIFAVASLVGTAWGIGALFGINEVRSAKATTVVTLQDAEMVGRMLRSGERGALFVDANRALVFLKWDQIKKMTAPAQPFHER